ncbi:MAG: GlsB/YeaQ/YmgE family stress response membrane protein [Candidatus Riflebacteria bacterium]|nr:GlsB/YeaQ/YmgE family stress response membrane protein [Candidatus Riflebacteria bacterium]
MDILWLIFVGLIAGWIATEILEGGANDLFEFMLVGVVGSMIGGLVIKKFGLTVADGFLGNVVTATIGAIVLILSLRIVIRH